MQQIKEKQTQKSGNYHIYPKYGHLNENEYFQCENGVSRVLFTLVPCPFTSIMTDTQTQQTAKSRLITHSRHQEDMKFKA